MGSGPSWERDSLGPITVSARMAVTSAQQGAAEKRKLPASLPTQNTIPRDDSEHSGDGSNSMIRYFQKSTIPAGSGHTAAIGVPLCSVRPAAVWRSPNDGSLPL